MDSQKTNIAIILEATLGGTRKHVVDLLTFLPPKEYEVTFIYASKRADDRFKKDIQWLKASSVQCVELPMTKSILNPVNLLCIFRLIRLFRSRKIEVLHLHGAVAGASGRAAALFCPTIRKVIYSPHGGVMHKLGTSFLSKVYVWVEKLLLTPKVSLIAVSSDEKEKLQSHLGIPASRIRMIPNGIDLSSLVRKEGHQDITTEKERLGIAPGDLVLLYPALFLEAKGHTHFFSHFYKENVALNPRIKILLAGDGPLQNEVRTLVAGSPVRDQVIFLGFVNKATGVDNNNIIFSYLFRLMGHIQLISAELAHQYFRIVNVFGATQRDDVYLGFNRYRLAFNFSFHF